MSEHREITARGFELNFPISLFPHFPSPGGDPMTRGVKSVKAAAKLGKGLQAETQIVRFGNHRPAPGVRISTFWCQGQDLLRLIKPFAQIYHFCGSHLW